MDAVGIAYLVVFLAGFSFLVITFLFGSMGVDAEHAEVGHGDVGAGDHGMTPGVFSFRVIACFLVGFGSGALISHFWITSEWSVPVKFPIDLALGSLGGFALGWTGWKIIAFFLSQQGGSEVRLADLVGVSAPLNVGIPDRGVGEISFVFANKRMSLDVRSEDGLAIPTGVKVVVVSMAGNVGIVKRV